MLVTKTNDCRLSEPRVTYFFFGAREAVEFESMTDSNYLGFTLYCILLVMILACIKIKNVSFAYIIQFLT